MSLVIVFPLLSPGYILTLDTVMTEKIALPAISSPSFFFVGLLALLNLFIPSYWLQKAMLFAIFFLSGWGMYCLSPVKNNWAKIFAGIFYAINPFVYERVMAGQWWLLLGYSLFPLFVSAVIGFFDHPDKNTALRLAILFTVIVNLVIHFSLITLLFFVIYGSIFLLLHQDKISPALKYFWIFTAAVLIFNLNWLLPAIIGRSSLNYAVSQFTSEDLIAFQSVEDKTFGLIFNLLSGYGFWPEVYPYFILAKDVIFIWPILSILFIVLFLLGFYRALIDHRWRLLAISLGILFLASLDLAGGIALKSFSQTTFLLYDKLPFLRGFREPQKLVSVVMFCYAYFSSFGLDYLTQKFRLSARYIVLVVLIMPFIYTPTVFAGFWGQLKPVFYPKSWEEVNRLLAKDKDDYLTLFFPWHQYMRFNFANNRVIANPAPYFFGKTILSSLNYETKSLYTHDTRPEALHIEGLLTMQKEGVNLVGEPVEEQLDWANALTAINVKYVILAKDDDWQTYKFLDTEESVKKIFADEEIIVYQNISWGTEDEPAAY
ncbi:YfhO family protein [Candidatus Gottesmanbacteria bacterium]|nr:YfhO family protein [Candidatus Gottesmanbacteria bacterium]